MSKFTAATFPSQPTASGVIFAGKQVGHMCQALRNTLFSAYFLEEGKLLFPVIKQVILQGIGQRQAQDLFSQKVYGRVWL